MTPAFTIVSYMGLILQALPLKVMRPPMLSAPDCPNSSTSPPALVVNIRGLVLNGLEPDDNPYPAIQQNASSQFRMDLKSRL